MTETETNWEDRLLPFVFYYRLYIYRNGNQHTKAVSKQRKVEIKASPISKTE